MPNKILILVFITIIFTGSPLTAQSKSDLMELLKTVQPGTIWTDKSTNVPLSGSQQANVTLTVNAFGKTTFSLMPMDVILLVDHSGSMLSYDGGSCAGRNRVQFAHLACSSFVDSMKADDRVGIMYFSSKIGPITKMTNNTATLYKALEDNTPVGSTKLYEGIMAALEMMKIEGRNGVSKAVIVLADGTNSRKWEKDSLGLYDSLDVINEAAIRFAKDGIKLFTVGLGSPQIHSLDPSSGNCNFNPNPGNFDEAFLDTVATAGYFPSPTGADMEQIYAKISKLIRNAPQRAVVTPICLKQGNVFLKDPDLCGQ